jgi:hypothetical protein
LLWQDIPWLPLEFSGLSFVARGNHENSDFGQMTYPNKGHMKLSKRYSFTPEHTGPFEAKEGKSIKDTKFLSQDMYTLKYPKSTVIQVKGFPAKNKA